MNWSALCEIVTLQITLYFLLIKLFGGKITKSFLCCPISSLILIVFLEYINYLDILFFLCDIVLYFILPLILIKNLRKSQIIYVSLATIGFFSFINVSTSFISTLINPDFADTGFGNIIVNILLTAITALICTQPKKGSSITNVLSLSKSVKIVLVFFVWELLILSTSLTVLLLQTDIKPIISFTCFIIFLIIIVSCIVVYLLIMNNLKSTYYKSINLNIQNNINKQVKHYEQLYKANENLRKFKHDFNNLKIGLIAHLKSNDVDGAIHYLNDCNRIIENEQILVHTGHNIVDALFYDKTTLAKENNIHIIFNGLIPADTLTPVDLCIIFGNTLDNAIESCLKIKNNSTKLITVTVEKRHDYLFIKFTNPISQDINIKDNTIPTSKDDGEMHGIGLYSIKQVLNKYDGHLSLNCKDNVFTTEFDFCISKN